MKNIFLEFAELKYYLINASKIVKYFFNTKSYFKQQNIIFTFNHSFDLLTNNGNFN